MSTLLWHLVRETNDISVIEANINKLPTENAVRCAVLNDKLAIADYLVSQGVAYNAHELNFYSPQSVVWAKQHNIDITLEQVAHYTYSANILRAIHENYPALIPSVDVTACGDDCINYLTSKCDVPITRPLVEYVLSMGYCESFVLMSHRISYTDYIPQIAKSSSGIVAHVLNTSDISVYDLGMDLFTGLDIKKKLKLYSSQMPAFASKAIEYNLLKLYLNERQQCAALYLVEHYDICMPDYSPMETAKYLIQDSYNELIEEDIGDEITIRNHKQQIAETQYSSVTELVHDFKERKI